MRERESVCVREILCVCVCVCVCERERERVCVCQRERERESVRESVCDKERERECVCWGVGVSVQVVFLVFLVPWKELISQVATEFFIPSKENVGCHSCKGYS